MEYGIDEFASITGISIDTLRYYEKEQLITPKRKSNGQHCYTDTDMQWIAFIKKLKDTCMPIKKIQKYATLRAQGDKALEARVEMLVQHHLALVTEIETMQEHLSKLDIKIDYYKDAISKKNNSLG